MTEGERSTQERADDVLRDLWREARDPNKPSAARVRALELVGKHLGMFADRVEITIERAGE